MTRPPYKPFHAGPPRFQVALSRIEPELWLSPDPEADWLALKGGRLDKDPSLYYRALPEAAPAEAEALSRIETATCKACSDRDEPALIAAGRLVSDDLVVMENRGEGWIATSLLLTQPTFFSLDDSFNRELHQLHDPVPGGNPGLAGKINRVFDRMPAGEVFERFNWTVQLGSERWWPHGSKMREQLTGLAPEDAIDQLWLRVERQTLVRLESTNAILFCIRICLDPLGSALADPADRAAFAKNWRAASADALAYKRWGQFNAHVEAALSAMDTP
ncbi:heme-dependent oxidative N-demethylase subunit alpha family protein [Hyphobacterium sp. HN65]|uniref:Heme-dependent oxidative N-demethylase subunit alpha family protein n=1 Tax=Hyphobacterium lacteum TaxID=3116575 RepID=A0ABU7LSX7_9PROT|nr:heme-dependent oxidative N-demethylase subunit alpha family protein [Hyphobacterium sp. HN65]MEE2527001.1 heme-dependent oxidative N-demethylase subunit alpha family protein [Hyphobacterium sp. HN65]